MCGRRVLAERIQVVWIAERGAVVVEVGPEIWAFGLGANQLLTIQISHDSMLLLFSS